MAFAIETRGAMHANGKKLVSSIQIKTGEPDTGVNDEFDDVESTTTTTT